METYVILRREGWRTAFEFGESTVNAVIHAERMLDSVSWIRSYAIDEHDGSVGSICVFEADSPEAIRRHAAAAGMPIDEIVKVADIVIVRPDPMPAMSSDNQRWEEA